MKNLFNVRIINLKGYKDYSFETFYLANIFYNHQIVNCVTEALTRLKEYVNVNIQLSNHKDEIVHEFVFESIPTNPVEPGKNQMVKIKDYEDEKTL